MEESLVSEADASSDEEEENQDFITELFGEGRREQAQRGATTPVTDDSILEVEEDEAGGRRTPTQRIGRRSPRVTDNASNNNKLQMELDSLKSVVEQLKGQSGMVDLLKQNADTLREVAQSTKRERGLEEKKKERPEDPIKVTWSEEGELLEDDNHQLFAWSCRRLYKQPNCEPRKYWEQANYSMQISPNLHESLYLTHLMPLGLSSKVLGWGHDLLATTAIKYYTHAQAAHGSKKRKSNITLEEDEEKMTQRVVTVGQYWAEASGLTEVVEGVHNWCAVRFMTAPWDYSGILLMRILHEVSFFTHVADSEEGQKTVCEKFIDEFLTTNRRRLMQRKPPLVYSKGITLAVDVVRSHNGKHDQLFNKASVYASNRLAKQYKEERDKAKQDKQVLQGENSNLRRRVKELEARAAGRTPRREDQRQKPRQSSHQDVDRAYREDRMEVRTAQKCVIPN